MFSPCSHQNNLQFCEYTCQTVSFSDQINLFFDRIFRLEEGGILQGNDQHDSECTSASFDSLFVYENRGVKSDRNEKNCQYFEIEFTNYFLNWHKRARYFHSEASMLPGMLFSSDSDHMEPKLTPSLWDLLGI